MNPELNTSELITVSAEKRIKALSQGDNVYENSRKSILEEMEDFCLTLGENIKAANKYLELLIRNKELERNTLIDSVTGLKNRKALEIELSKIIDLEEREKEDYAVLMLDLDNFKSINDKYGHLFGDEVLKMVGEAITGSIRNSDFSYRYGGEEFAVLLTGTNIRNAFGVAQEIRKEIEKLEVSYERKGEKSAARLSVSIGCISKKQIENGSVGDPADIKVDMLSKADLALLLAKESNKNIVRVFYPEKEIKY
jgi:diguanylate cyclase (GGDEF)-like protein